MPQGKVFYCKDMPNANYNKAMPNAEGGKGRLVKTYPKLVTDWKVIIERTGKMAMRGRDAMTGPVIVGYSYFRSRPKGKLAWEVPIQRPDLENYDELVSDALTGTVYEDDSQIVGHLGWPLHGKHYVDDFGARTNVAVVTLDEWNEGLIKELCSSPRLWGDRPGTLPWGVKI